MNVAMVPDVGSRVADPSGLTRHRAEVNDTRIHYVMGGTGPAAVLLHAWPYTWVA